MKQTDASYQFYDSDINKRLKVGWIDSKKVLNTKRTNYSFGGLQKVLNRGLNIIPINRIKSVLVLGMGAGSVVDSLRNKFEYDGPIVGVELDPVVIDIAEKEFNLLQDDKVEIIQADAKEYIASCKQQFDLIVVDVFIDIDVPEKFYSSLFWNHIESRVSDNGFVLFNAGIDLSDEKRNNFINKIPDSFIYTKKLNVLESNTVFVFQKVF